MGKGDCALIIQPTCQSHIIISLSHDFLSALTSTECIQDGTRLVNNIPQLFPCFSVYNLWDLASS